MNTKAEIKINEGRALYSTVDGIKYARIPIETHFIELGEDLFKIIDTYAKPQIVEGDVLCVATKIVSITQKMVVHKDDVRISPLAKLIARFVTKWEHDIGYSNPRKIQVAINTVGYPRIFLALLGGTIMKYIFAKPGYFYKIAGNRINAIDGFTEGFTEKQIFEDYAFLPPSEQEADLLANKIEKHTGAPSVILDGNNIENNIMGMSDSAKMQFDVPKFMEIVKGNPQGQEDDPNNTPFLIVRKE